MVQPKKSKHSKINRPTNNFKFDIQVFFYYYSMPFQSASGKNIQTQITSHKFDTECQQCIYRNSMTAPFLSPPQNFKALYLPYCKKKNEKKRE